MQRIGKWFEITLCASFVLILLAALGLYILSDHQIVVGQWGP